MLNAQINVKSIEDILSEQQTNQKPDDEDEHEEANTCNNVTEHLNAL
jgi:hypothetical protein